MFKRLHVLCDEVCKVASACVDCVADTACDVANTVAETAKSVAGVVCDAAGRVVSLAESCIDSVYRIARGK